MKFEYLLAMVGKHPVFDLATIVQLSGEPRDQLRVQLHRWIKLGRIISVKRGLYVWSENYRRVPLNQVYLANQLVRPSYLSGIWALGYYGLIPEMVFRLTSVTSRAPCFFENVFGAFEYRHIKRAVFSGYLSMEMNGDPFFIAKPEKALLDYWYLSTGDWSDSRMKELRLQNHELIDHDTLFREAAAFQSPRLLRICRAWKKMVEDDEKGTVTL